jgi:hypothetical protein
VRGSILSVKAIAAGWRVIVREDSSSRKVRFVCRVGHTHGARANRGGPAAAENGAQSAAGVSRGVGNAMGRFRFQT